MEKSPLEKLYYIPVTFGIIFLALAAIYGTELQFRRLLHPLEDDAFSYCWLFIACLALGGLFSTLAVFMLIKIYKK